MDGQAKSIFEWDVAASESNLIAGAWGDLHNRGRSANSTYIFSPDVKSENEGWAQTNKILAGVGPEEERFGSSVSVYNNTVVISARDDNEKRGCVYVINLEFLDSFGRSLALAGDDTIVVGAPYHNNGGGPSVGCVYVFTRQQDKEECYSCWKETHTLKATDGQAKSIFGWNVAASESNIIVGAWGDPQNGGRSADSTYIFSPDVKSESNGWAQTNKIIAGVGPEEERFGSSVSVYNNTVVISARDDNEKRGCVYVINLE
eukprot:CAMPEP_0194348340 /NCGR_PEP_ID=MMETSP0171-20130528/106483_1 /TAXON_ID=218684 /ORGANISM="Corethron pennatum, Strain L29A3" /LENGTH=259 /DNA_ID=CAMNT_0039115677 /DNA_START=205 /DNA_END=981 /DNA_ORIENTATION=-